MKISVVRVGPIMTNCYCLADEQTGVCAVIDPGDEPQKIKKMIQDSGCELNCIYLTHGHFDHYTGLSGLLKDYPDIPVYINEKDVVDHGSVNQLKFPRLSDKNQRFYKDGDIMTLGKLSIKVLETPGHSIGSVCLLVEDIMFSGDTLFYCSCGRTDFPDGSYEEILHSLSRLAALEGNYHCLPGHDRSTTLDFERNHNPYMRQGIEV